jgi:hypothetical protein
MFSCGVADALLHECAAPLVYIWSAAFLGVAASPDYQKNKETDLSVL